MRTILPVEFTYIVPETEFSADGIGLFHAVCLINMMWAIGIVRNFYFLRQGIDIKFWEERRRLRTALVQCKLDKRVAALAT